MQINMHVRARLVRSVCVCVFVCVLVCVCACVCVCVYIQRVVGLHISGVVCDC